MNKIFNGSRLKEARLYNKLSITELAEKLNVTKQMISKYENGKSEPTFEKSLQLFKILDFPREFFYSEDISKVENKGTFFRSRLTATQKSKQPASILLKYTVIVRDFLEGYLEFPELLHVDLDNDEQLDFETLATLLRKKLGIGDQPIEDIVEIAESMGFTVINTDYQEDKVDAFGSLNKINDNEYYVIATGHSSSFYRQQFSLAHEIGHWILHQDLNPQELDKDEYKTMEEEANRFASAFLLPKDTFTMDLTKKIIDDIDSYYSLKKIWKVSMAAMIKRARDLDIISSEQEIKLYKQMHYRKWKNPEPFDNTTPVPEPVVFKQAFELLIDNNILKGHEIPLKIAEEYNLFITNKMLAAISGVNEAIFTNNSESKVVIKLKDFSNKGADII
ncbi:XRE family transcriptional regulator [Rummeliibacillus pycnus]|uniref:XRE family transcriptional regulator n=1 Tax=Rummeliibacillus pycnus TaxID=101070 RepID=UPI000C9B108A|nr:XRE family transcriptional regulator [Rummeliibacillus pycnus]